MTSVGEERADFSAIFNCFVWMAIFSLLVPGMIVALPGPSINLNKTLFFESGFVDAVRFYISDS